MSRLFEDFGAVNSSKGALQPSKGDQNPSQSIPKPSQKRPPTVHGRPDGRVAEAVGRSSLAGWSKTDESEAPNQRSRFPTTRQSAQNVDSRMSELAKTMLFTR